MWDFLETVTSHGLTKDGPPVCGVPQVNNSSYQTIRRWRWPFCAWYSKLLILWFLPRDAMLARYALYCPPLCPFPVLWLFYTWSRHKYIWGLSTTSLANQVLLQDLESNTVSIVMMSDISNILLVPYKLHVDQRTNQNKKHLKTTKTNIQRLYLSNISLENIL